MEEQYFRSENYFEVQTTADKYKKIKNINTNKVNPMIDLTDYIKFFEQNMFLRTLIKLIKIDGIFSTNILFYIPVLILQVQFKFLLY